MKIFVVSRYGSCDEPTLADIQRVFSSKELAINFIKDYPSYWDLEIDEFELDSKEKTRVNYSSYNNWK